MRWGEGAGDRRRFDVYRDRRAPRPPHRGRHRSHDPREGEAKGEGREETAASGGTA